MKRCPRCATHKPNEDFGRRKSARDGLHPWCRKCVSSACKAWQLANREKAKANMTAYRAAHRQEARERTAQWRRDNPERSAAATAKWRKENAERHKILNAEWRAANKEALVAKKAVWASANKERITASGRNRRARKHKAEGSHTHKEIQGLAIRQRFRCANPTCRQSIKAGWHADHIMPLTLGGANWIRNIQLLCQFCNISKHAKHPIDWARQNGLLL